MSSQNISTFDEIQKFYHVLAASNTSRCHVSTAPQQLNSDFALFIVINMQ